MTDKIIQAVCKMRQVTYNDAIGRYREKNLLFTRMTIAYFLRQYTSLSLTQIGCLLHRNHSTVSHYLATYEAEFLFNGEFRNFAKKIKEMLDDVSKDSFTMELEDEFNEIYG